MSDEDLRRSIEALRSQIEPLKAGAPSDRLYKLAVYVETIGKSWDALKTAAFNLEKEKVLDPDKNRQNLLAQVERFKAVVKNSLRFARINLDAALMEALDSAVKRPRSASKSDEQKKSLALKRVFDGSTEPGKAMLQHYRASSDPLDKWLVVGPWGHEYLMKRSIGLEDFDREICGMLKCEEIAAGRIILSYSHLCRALEAVEETALRSADALLGPSSPK
jgi:hypothetical protein